MDITGLKFYNIGLNLSSYTFCIVFHHKLLSPSISTINFKDFENNIVSYINMNDFNFKFARFSNKDLHLLKKLYLTLRIIKIKN